jgi:hypothetical protein
MTASWNDAQRRLRSDAAGNIVRADAIELSRSPLRVALGPPAHLQSQPAARGELCQQNR